MLHGLFYGASRVLVVCVSRYFGVINMCIYVVAICVQSQKLLNSGGNTRVKTLNPPTALKAGMTNYDEQLVRLSQPKQPRYQQELINMANDGQPNGTTMERTGMGRPWLIDASITARILADNRASGIPTNLELIRRQQLKELFQSKTEEEALIAVEK